MPAAPALAASTRLPASTTWVMPSSSATGGGVDGTRPAETSAAMASACDCRVSSRLSVSTRRWVRTRAAPVTDRTAATARAATAVIRKRTVARSRAISDDPVTGSPHRLDRPAPVGFVELAAQAADVDLDDVGVAREVAVPHGGQDAVLGQHLAGPAHQRLE